MQAVYEVSCGLDVHKRTVTACLLIQRAQGKPEKTIRTFGTMTNELRGLAEWLRAADCRHVAMESTGVYWKPVYNALELIGAEILLVNAQHIKNVPGRKTDVKDVEWIAQLLQHGLLRGSFVPPPEIRELRELTRYRKKLIERRADQCNRIQKLLEAGNIKLASVASDVLGVSGMLMLEALVAGNQDAAAMADLARGQLRKKIPQLEQALNGLLSETQRWLLGEQLHTILDLEQAIARLDAKIEELCRPFAPALEKLQEIPGISRRLAETIVAEIGLDMSRFPTAAHLASWAGICPGHHESAGKRQSGRMRPGNRWLKAGLTEAGWAAARTKDNYLSSKYHQLARRRGAKKACLAVAHSILKIAHALLSDNDRHYQDLGPDWLRKTDQAHLTRKLIRQLESFGLKVTVESTAA